MMLNAIFELFTSFNPIILGVMLSAGAYIALRHRTVPSAHRLRQMARDAIARPFFSHVPCA
jgi:hypothetical protein